MFGRRAVGGLLLSVYQRVRRLLGEPGFLLVLVHVVFLHLRVVCPYFRHFGVLVLVILDGDRVGPVLLDGVFDLVQLLPHVVGGVVLGGRAGVAAGLPPLPHAPVEGRHQTADPSHRQDRAQQGDQEICSVLQRTPLNSHFCDGRDKRAVAVTFTDKVYNFVSDFLDRVSIIPYVFGRNGHMYFIVCGRGRFTSYVDGIFGRNILQNIQIPQFTANVLRGKSWGHHLFVEGERDVCAVILVIGVSSTLGLHGLEARGATLAHPSAGANETLVIQDGDAALSAGALAVPFVEQARPRATPDLGAGNPSVQALTGIAVIVPLGPIWYHTPHGDARSP